MVGLSASFATVGFRVRVVVIIFEALCIYGKLWVFLPPGALLSHLPIMMGFDIFLPSRAFRICSRGDICLDHERREINNSLLNLLVH